MIEFVISMSSLNLWFSARPTTRHLYCTLY